MWQMRSDPIFQLAVIPDVMDKAKEPVYSIWVDWENRVISFQKAEGFEKLEYPTHDEMFAFAIEKGSGGFAIQ